MVLKVFKLTRGNQKSWFALTLNTRKHRVCGKIHCNVMIVRKERTVFILFKYLLQLMLYILVDRDLLNSALLI